LQYALSGESPQNWSAGAGGFKSFSGAVMTISPVVFNEYFGPSSSQTLTRVDTIYIDKYTGVIATVQGQDGYVYGNINAGATAAAQPVPENAIRLLRKNSLFCCI